MADRRLILMRHAKSSWGDATLPDRQRPLNDRGRRDAPRIARQLAALGWIPTLVCSSDAVRTRETWQAMAGEFAAAGGAAIDVMFTPDLYLADLAALIDQAFTWDPAEPTVLALGHNPGWENALSTMIGRSQSMATAVAACLTSSRGTNWQEALHGPWTLAEFLEPKAI